MLSWKRKAVFLLTTSAVFFSLFWVTAFSAEKVEDREAGKAIISHVVITAPASIDLPRKRDPGSQLVIG